MSARPAQGFRLNRFTPRRTILIVAAFIVASTLLATAARPIAAADPAVGAWLAEEVRGTVLVRAAGEAATSWQPLQAAVPIAGQSEIATGSDGVAVLDNGVDHIRLTPNSRLVLPAHEDAGLMTIIRQSLGKIFFDIGPRPDRSFEVDAPYLVVLVKGTHFAVNSNYLGDSVAVTEGTVEVRAVAGGKGAGTLIGAGQTASVGAGGGSVSVGAGGSSNGAGSGHGTGRGEPQLNKPQIRTGQPPGGGGGEGSGEENGGSEGEGGEQSGAGGGPGSGDGGDPDPGNPGDGGGEEGGGHGCEHGHGHGGESGD